MRYALTAAEKAATREAQDALRTKLPLSERTRKLLASAHRKDNMRRYGKPNAHGEKP